MRVREDADRTRDALDTSRFVVALWSAVSIESDSGRAEALVAGHLTSAGLSVWWDRHIPGLVQSALCLRHLGAIASAGQHQERRRLSRRDAG